MVFMNMCLRWGAYMSLGLTTAGSHPNSLGKPTLARTQGGSVHYSSGPRKKLRRVRGPGKSLLVARRLLNQDMSHLRAPTKVPSPESLGPCGALRVKS